MISSEEVHMIQLLTEAIFPGANEARVYEFILRDMRSNPWMAKTYRQTLGELNELSFQMYKTNIIQLDNEQLTRLLVRYETTPFFQFMREHTLEGMFSDPIYGGNYKAYGWRLIGFAGSTFHPPETLDEAQPPTVYYSLEGIAYENKDKDGL
ncbi:gluconate 2-dehydrogenase subunit 3 family protein [Paenibacillus tarimensis]